MFQARSLEKFEATPLVVDGVLYTVQAPNDVIALDAVTGRDFLDLLLLAVAASAPLLRAGESRAGHRRRHAVHGDHRCASDCARRQDRQVLCGTPTVAKAAAGYAITHAPLVIKDKVIVGTAGGEFGIRGFIAAYDVRTGKEVWRFNTIPGPGEPGHETWAGRFMEDRRRSIWMTGSYDPALNLTYWGVGNAGPDYNGDVRLGDNLYSQFGGRPRCRHAES